MIITALGYTAIVWVLVSWIKIIVPEDSKYRGLLCIKCISLWVTLIFTFNPFTAAIAGLIGALVECYFDNVNIKL